jgi:hypothetical protein
MVDVEPALAVVCAPAVPPCACGGGDAVVPPAAVTVPTAGGVETLPPAFGAGDVLQGGAAHEPPAGLFEVLEHAVIEDAIASAKPKRSSSLMSASGLAGLRRRDAA